MGIALSTACCGGWSRNPKTTLKPNLKQAKQAEILWLLRKLWVSSFGVAESGDEIGAGCLKMRFNSSRFSATPFFSLGKTQAL
jgi:hypothetical protein